MGISVCTVVVLATLFACLDAMADLDVPVQISWDAKKSRPSEWEKNGEEKEEEKISV